MRPLFRSLAAAVCILGLAVHGAPPDDVEMEDKSTLTWPAQPALVWDPIHKTCDGISNALGTSNDKAAQNTLVGDVINLATNALRKMDQLRIHHEQVRKNLDIAKTMAMFNQFFDLQSPGAQDRWSAVQNALEAIRHIRSQPYVYIMCDDAPTFVGTNPRTGMVKQVAPHDSDIYQYKHPGTHSVCSSGRSQIAYRWNWPEPRSATYPQYVIVCNAQNRGDMVVDNVKGNVAEGQSLDQYITMSTTLFHEFLHVAVDNMRADDSGGSAAGGERYEFAGAMSVRDTYATENPDSVTLFALSLALENWFWDENGLAVTPANWVARVGPNVFQGP